MEKKYKLRLILMFTILPIIMVALSVSIVLVARQVTVGTKMNVTFTSNEIDCKITGSAKYKVTGKESSYTNAKVAGSTSTSKTLTFAAGVDYNGTYSIDFEKIDIDANGEAIYAFSIENTGSKSICAKVTVGNVNNMVRNITSGEYITNTEGVSGYIIHAGQTKNFEIKLTVNDKSIDASATSEISMVLANEFPASEIAAKAVDRDGTVLAVAAIGSSTIQLPTNIKTTSIDDNGTTKYFQGYVKSNSATANLSGDDHDKNYTYSAITALPSNLILPLDEITYTIGDVFTSYYGGDSEDAKMLNYTEIVNGWRIEGVDSNYENSITNLVIPTLYRGKLVTEIAFDAFSGLDSIETIIVSNSIQLIEAGAFSMNSSLTNIYFGCGIQCFDSTWFDECPQLSSITLSPLHKTYTSSDSEGVECNGIINKFTKELVMGCKSTTIPSDGSVTKIAGYAFYGVYIVNIDIPNIIESIGDYAFNNCIVLKEITLPDGIRTIGYNAFEGCTKLSKIILPNNLLELKGYTFSECSSLTSVTIPSSVKYLGQCVFGNCLSLNIIFEDPGNWYNNFGELMDFSNVSNIVTYLSDYECYKLI